MRSRSLVAITTALALVILGAPVYEYGDVFRSPFVSTVFALTCHSESAPADEESPSLLQSSAEEEILRFAQDDTDCGVTQHPDPELEKFLAEFDDKRTTLEDYRATFRQRKYNRLFNEFSEPATGELSYKRPGRVQWDYRSPDEMTVLLRDRRVYLYIADMNQMEVYDFRDRQSLRGLFLGFDQTTDELRATYRITLLGPDDRRPGTRGVELEPRATDIAAYFTRVKLWLRNTDFAVVRILIEGPEKGNLTTIDLTDIRINTAIPDSTFEINVPPDTTVIEHTADELQPVTMVDDAPEKNRD